jgi:hypothetical protein
MSGVFRNVDPPPPLPASVYPPPLVRGEGTLAGWRGGGGSIVRKTPDIALYSIYVSTLVLWLGPYTYRAQSLGPALLAGTEAGCTQDWRMKKSYPLHYMRVIAISQIILFILIMAPFHSWINYC